VAKSAAFSKLFSSDGLLVTDVTGVRLCWTGKFELERGNGGRHPLFSCRERNTARVRCGPWRWELSCIGGRVAVWWRGRKS